MPKFTQFSINFPEDLEPVTKAASLNESLSVIQQDKLFSDPAFAKSVVTRGSGSLESIYGKAARLTEGKTEQDHHQAIQEIADSYRDQSNLDAKQINSLRLIIDNEEIKLNNFAKLVLSHHNLTYATKPKAKPTMDMVVDYLQDEYMLKISTEQRNFLRTQWNQTNITGLSTPLQTTNNIAEQFNSFTFEKGKLLATKFTTVIEQATGDKSGDMTVTANLKALQGKSSEQNPPLIPENWIPHNSAKISIDYRSNNGLALEVNKDLVNTLQGHFTGKPAEKHYLNKAKTAVKGLTLNLEVDSIHQKKYDKLPGSLPQKGNRSV